MLCKPPALKLAIDGTAILLSPSWTKVCSTEGFYTNHLGWCSLCSQIIMTFGALHWYLGNHAGTIRSCKLESDFCESSFEGGSILLVRLKKRQFRRTQLYSFSFWALPKTCLLLLVPIRAPGNSMTSFRFRLEVNISKRA